MRLNRLKYISERFNKAQLFFILCLLVNYNFYGQATIRESTESIQTYTFDDPNPVPILEENPKIYPYFKFEGYEHVAKDKDWKVVTLENEYIKLSVLPQVGGKIWGAIEKKTGEEFIYKNEVLKFRNIAMRGPWTSGGVEFNFGIIGHTPATATPVDYVIKENEDGSVSCIVGAMDLPSRTRWWVEINLQKDKAYFETKASWYNPTSLNQSYYNWMTAAAEAKNDLEFFIPGNKYLKHNGNAKLWPIDEQGRDLSYYKNNNFGPHKSYHIVGDYKDFFGGYYHDTNFGFGHWSPYEEMPGQKLWLWALSRNGGIWEDLLTDTDGQYIEFQAGRLLNQYQPNAEINPITQANFEPHAMDTWREIWFPFKEIGGMVDASEYGVLNVVQEGEEVHIGINALQKLDENINVYIDGVEVVNERLVMNTLDIFTRNIPAKTTDIVKVVVGRNKLHYISKSEASLLKRPFYSDENLEISKVQKLYTEGWELMKYREFGMALSKLTELIEIDPSHKDGLLKLAALEYRRTNYDMALKYANSVLKMDTYNPEANYRAGVIYRAKRDYVNALESLGWAARDMKYRSVAYAQMSEIYLIGYNIENAKIYALKALDFNTYNLNARKVLLVLARRQKEIASFETELNKILEIDPLNHFAAFEVGLVEANFDIKNNIQNEFVEETLLELALEYRSIGLIEESIKVLSKADKSVKAKLWLAYILKDTSVEKSQAILKESVNMPSEFVSPYRQETIPVLEWAIKQNQSWKLKYYLAQNYIAIGLKEKGLQLLKACKNTPDIDSFYRFRAAIMNNSSYETRLNDYQKALVLNDRDWKIWDAIIQFYSVNNKYDEAHSLGVDAFKRFPNNYNIILRYANTVLYVGEYAESIAILKDLVMLPAELGEESRRIYYDSHVFLANKYMEEEKYEKAISVLNNSKEWPENLGVGKPYNVDNRLQDYLLAICNEKLTSKVDTSILNSIVDYTTANVEKPSANHFFGLLSLRKLGLDHEELLLELRKPDRDQSEITNMVIAFFENNELELTRLKKKEIVSDGLWNIMESARDFN